MPLEYYYSIYMYTEKIKWLTASGSGVTLPLQATGGRNRKETGKKDGKV